MPRIISSGLHPMTKRYFADRPVDVRHVPSPIYVTVEGGNVPRQAVWMRARSPLPDDPAVHRAALAYLSDMTIQESILRAHGVSWTTPGLKVASLDHAMWWHRPGRVDDWLLYVQESPERARRPRTRDRDGSTPATARSSPASPRRSWSGCPRSERAVRRASSAAVGVDDRRARRTGPRRRALRA